MVFTPSNENIRISVNGMSGFALQQISLDRDNVDTLVNTYLVSRGYRYGFNGMEKDDEVKGKGNSYDFGARFYDSRLGRWLSIDAVSSIKPDLSSYQGLKNNPVIYVDPDGHDEFISIVIKQEGRPNIILRRFQEISNRVRAGAVENVGGGLFRQTFYDYKNITTIHLDDKGAIVRISKSLYTLKDNPRFTRQTNSLGYGILLHKNGDTFTSVDDWVREGKGGKQTSGVTWVIGDGGVSPVRQKVLKGAEVRDVEELIGVFGGLKLGSLGNELPDNINKVEEIIGKVLEIEESLSNGKKNIGIQNSEMNNKEIYPGWQAKDTLILDVNKDSSKFKIGTSNLNGTGKTGLHKETLSKQEVKEKYPTVLK